MVGQALEHFGRIDILVNNAGGQFSAPAEDITSKGWRAVHRLAVDATWAVTREVAVRAMIPQRSGVIFFMAFSPRRGIPAMVHATSARAALENLASGLSLEWSRYGIRTICIAPGTIATEGMEHNYSAEDRAQWEAAVPLGRLGTADDVSGVIAFLASPAARYITGTTILVDGGTARARARARAAATAGAAAARPRGGGGGDTHTNNAHTHTHAHTASADPVPPVEDQP